MINSVTILIASINTTQINIIQFSKILVEFQEWMGSPGYFKLPLVLNTWKWRAWLIKKLNSKSVWSLKRNFSIDSLMPLFPAVNCSGDTFIKSKKKSSHVSSCKHLTKTTIRSWNLIYPICQCRIQIIFGHAIVLKSVSRSFRGTRKNLYGEGLGFKNNQIRCTGGRIFASWSEFCFQAFADCFI